MAPYQGVNGTMLVTALVTLLGVTGFCIVLATTALLIAFVNHDIALRFAVGIPIFSMILCPLLIVNGRMKFDLRPITRADLCIALIGSLCAPLLFLLMFQYLIETFYKLHLSKDAILPLVLWGLALILVGAAPVYRAGLMK